MCALLSRLAWYAALQIYQNPQDLPIHLFGPALPLLQGRHSRQLTTQSTASGNKSQDSITKKRKINVKLSGTEPFHFQPLLNTKTDGASLRSRNKELSGHRYTEGQCWNSQEGPPS